MLPLSFTSPIEAPAKLVARQLEDELHCQLHIAAFEVAAGKDATLRGNKARRRIACGISEAADVQRAWYDEQVRMVDNIKCFQAKLHGVAFAELHPFV